MSLSLRCRFCDVLLSAPVVQRRLYGGGCAVRERWWRAHDVNVSLWGSVGCVLASIDVMVKGIVGHSVLLPYTKLIVAQ